jgi:hypothetical protein
MSPTRRIKRNFSKFINKKNFLEEIPTKTMRVTIYALRWVFFLIFIFITIGIIALFLTGGENYVQIILGYSIAGFFTFFMGYFGWILAQGMIETITGKEEKYSKNYNYYFSRKKRFRD